MCMVCVGYAVSIFYFVKGERKALSTVGIYCTRVSDYAIPPSIPSSDLGPNFPSSLTDLARRRTAVKLYLTMRVTALAAP